MKNQWSFAPYLVKNVAQTPLGVRFWSKSPRLFQHIGVEFLPSRFANGLHLTLLTSVFTTSVQIAIT